jgi:formate dehydrogenase major subunit
MKARREMELSRRDFIKLSGAGLGAAAVAKLGITMPASAKSIPLRIARASETIGVCSFCAVGCGTIVSGLQEGDQHHVVNVEGNPDNAINFGTLCSKGAATIQKSYIGGTLNSQRLTGPRYRARGSSSWQQISWDDAFNRIALKIKDTRDASWIKEDDVVGPDGNPTGQKVPANRTEAIGSLGSAELSNEGAYLYQKFSRALGVVYIEHHARL